MPIDQQWAFIEEKAQREAGVPLADLRRLANVCKAHLTAIWRFRPQPYVGPAVLLRATQPRRRLDRRWKTVCPQLQVERAPGNHFTMLRTPYMETLAERLNRILDEAGVDGPTTS
jgi:thioesterase domain-containing protein